VQQGEGGVTATPLFRPLVQRRSHWRWQHRASTPIEENRTMDRRIADGNDANRDPITGAEGAHPVGTGLGATGGATAGAIIGAPGGPLGVVAGAAAGGIIGGLVGKGVGEIVNPTHEDEYWRANFAEEPYVRTDFIYEDYEPAYRVGYLGAARRDGRSFEDAEPQLREQYERVRGGSPLQWHAARVAARAAWDRVADGTSRH
jgi:hypothetical protein